MWAMRLYLLAGDLIGYADGLSTAGDQRRLLRMLADTVVWHGVDTWPAAALRTCPEEG